MIYFIVIILIISVFLLIAEMNARFIIRQFERNNVIVYGKKGRGKDLLFSFVMYRRKKPFSSNIDFGQPKEDIREIGEYNVDPNTFQTLINGERHYIDKTFSEKKDYYISDGGIFLPSQYDSTLNKSYPSLPIVYALSRHLGLFNIHINSQSLTRIWIKLREQADGFFMARGVIHLPRYSIHFSRYYELEQSAMQFLKPFPKKAFNNNAQAEKLLYDTQHGDIRNLFIIIDRRKVNYDSRYFHRVMFGEVSPTTRDKEKKQKKM